MSDDRARLPVTSGRRTVIAALIFLGVTVLSFALGSLLEARTGRGPLADVGWVAVPMAATAWLAPHASYRRRDALLCLLGPGFYIFAVIAWRVAYTPYRDWAPRPDELPRVRWLRDPEYAGLWYLADEVGQISERDDLLRAP